MLSGCVEGHFCTPIANKTHPGCKIGFLYTRTINSYGISSSSDTYQ